MTNNESENRINLIANNPKKAILELSWPMMVFMALMIGYNIINSIWVAGLGIESLAAIGFIAPIYAVVIGFGQGIGAGTTSLLARSIGAKDKIKSHNTIIHSFLITLISAIVITAIILIFLKHLLILIGGSSVLEIAIEYGRILFLGSFTMLFGLWGASILRAEGDMKKVTYSMGISSILNIILDPILIYTLNMGVSGAALATIISSSISTIAIFYWVFTKKSNYIQVKFKEFKFKSSIIKDILVVSLPASLEDFMFALSTIGMNTILSFVGGSAAVAIYTVGWRIVTLGIIPARGIEIGTLTVAGVAFGAKNWKNLEIISNYAIKIGVIIGSIISILTFIFAPQITMLFTYSSSGELGPGLITFIRILSLFFVAIPFGLISTSIFQAAGKGVTSLILNFTRDIMFSLVFAYILAIPLNLGEIGVYIGIVSGIIIGSIFNYLYFRRYLTKLKKEFITKTKKEDIYEIN